MPPFRQCLSLALVGLESPPEPRNRFDFRVTMRCCQGHVFLNLTELAVLFLSEPYRCCTSVYYRVRSIGRTNVGPCLGMRGSSDIKRQQNMSVRMIRRKEKIQGRSRSGREAHVEFLSGLLCLQAPL